MLRVVWWALPVVLAVYSLVDLTMTPAEESRLMARWAWAVVVVLVPVVGPLAWLLVGTGRLGGGQGGQPRRPSSPDDDPDFLRGLG